MYMILNGKGSNWLWSTRVQSGFLSILTDPSTKMFLFLSILG